MGSFRSTVTSGLPSKSRLKIFVDDKKGASAEVCDYRAAHERG